MDPSARERGEERQGWSRVTAFPIMLLTIVGVLWRGRRAERKGLQSLVPEVPHPRVLKDARLR